MLIAVNVGKTMPFLRPMTGNGKHSTYKNGDDWGMVFGIVLTTFNKTMNLLNEVETIKFTVSETMNNHDGPII
jgi:hypothetical protein